MKKIFMFHPVFFGTLLSLFAVSIDGLWAQATPNAGFETWTTTGFPSYASATGWDSPNSQTALVGSFVCVKATGADVHSGNAAVKLITKHIFTTDAPGIVTTGKLPTASGDPITGGISYTLRPDSIVGWYKYTPAGGDNGFFKLYLFGAAAGNADTVAVGTFRTPTTTVGAYTRFTAPIVYYSANAVANSMWVISSSKNGDSAVVGSILFADDMDIIINPVGIKEQTMSDIVITPNPVADRVMIKNTSGSKVVFILTDVTGRKVAEERVEGVTSFMDVHALPVGLYSYSLTNDNTQAIRTGKLIIER